MDCARLKAEFGWAPVHSSRAVMDAFAHGQTEELIEAPSPPQEYELQVYLQQRRRKGLLPMPGNAARGAGGAS